MSNLEVCFFKILDLSFTGTQEFKDGQHVLKIRVSSSIAPELLEQSTWQGIEDADKAQSHQSSGSWAKIHLHLMGLGLKLLNMTSLVWILTVII